MINGKIWGATERIFDKNNVEIHRIVVKPGGFCSKHKHDHKFNMFFVESGSLHVEVFQNDYDLVDTTILQAGDATSVAPGVYHRFVATEHAVVYEIYWTELSASDIVREDVGGVNAPALEVGTISFTSSVKEKE